ncbi:cytochrome c biogenesis protein ResB [Pseudolysinimonas sp.]|jgi:cytochrome c biogenesis protein
MASFRPSDAISAEPQEATPDGAPPTLPRLGPIGFARFLWRQLTSMRTALVLLLLLALVAVPGSLIPQRTSNPNGVAAWQRDDPELYRNLDALGLFNLYSSPWFSAVYILLFVSLVGCILPRAKHHFDALRSRPPRTPARLSRLVGFSEATTPLAVEDAVDAAGATLRKRGYRVERYGDSISAERGYLKETGNLIFHISLVGVLVFVALGDLLGSVGQRVIIEGQPFVNVEADYDTFTPGSWFNPDSDLVPFSVRLDSFDDVYSFADNRWNPEKFTANMSVREPGGEWESRTLEVNSPLDIGGTQIYLLGNGYAIDVTVRDPEGREVFAQPIPFLATDNNLTSMGVIKVPDGLAEQVGMRGFFYPRPYALPSGALASFQPQLDDSALMTLMVYSGNIGLDDGTDSNVYSLRTDNLTELAGRDDPISLGIGETKDLPNGLGTITFDGVVRYIGVDIHRDPVQVLVLVFTLLAIGGLLAGVLVPRRRIWIKAIPGPDGTRLEYAGLARGEDAALPAEVTEVARLHTESLERRMTS